MPLNRFKAALGGGARLAGLWSQLASPTVVEILAHAGADWLLVDMEHGPSDYADVLHQLMAANGAPTPVLVRAPGHDPVLLKRLLDLGCESLLIPMVDSREEAERLAAAVRYPPLGFRGLAGSVRAAAYGRDVDYARQAAAQTCLMVQIESPRAVDAAAEIAAVDGVDALFVGPGDLSAGMGHLGDPRHPEVAAAIARVLAAGAAAGKPVGIFALDADDALRRFDEGFRFVSVATDSHLVRVGAEAALARVRGG